MKHRALSLMLRSFRSILLLKASQVITSSDKAKKIRDHYTPEELKVVSKFIAHFLKEHAEELYLSDRHRTWLYIKGVIHGVIHGVILILLIPLLWGLIKQLF